MDPLLKYDLVDTILAGFSNVTPQQIIIEDFHEWASNVWEDIIYENNDDKPPRAEFENKLQEFIDAQP